MRAKLLASTLVALIGVAPLSGARAVEINTGYFGEVAIRGYDPVAYFTEGKAIRGAASHEFEWLGATWRFSSEQHRDLFAASPASYAPQYGGLCSEGVAADGEATVSIDPESWQIID